MIRYVRIPVTQFRMKAFKDRYLELTNEAVQDDLPMNYRESHYVFASNRISPNVANTLREEFPKVKISRRPLGRSRHRNPSGGANWTGKNIDIMRMLKKDKAPMSIDDDGNLIVYNQDGTETVKPIGSWIPEEN